MNNFKRKYYLAILPFFIAIYIICNAEAVEANKSSQQYFGEIGEPFYEISAADDDYVVRQLETIEISNRSGDSIAER